jgi:hypothetical protein
LPNSGDVVSRRVLFFRINRIDNTTTQPKNNTPMKNIIKAAAFVVVLAGIATQASANCYTEGNSYGCIKPKKCTNSNPKAGNCK